jgi:hypothetical protein
MPLIHAAARATRSASVALGMLRICCCRLRPAASRLCRPGGARWRSCRTGSRPRTAAARTGELRSPARWGLRPCSGRRGGNPPSRTLRVMPISPQRLRRPELPLHLHRSFALAGNLGHYNRVVFGGLQIPMCSRCRLEAVAWRGHNAFFCRVCGRSVDEVGRMSARYKCRFCGVERCAENAISLNAHRGPYFEHWRRKVGRT